MTDSTSISSQKYLRNQYHNTSNLDARIRLHLECSTNKYGWQRWLYDHIKISSCSNILELGCGPGNLWLENISRIPERSRVVLSDLSPGMLSRAIDNLVNLSPVFRFNLINAQSIPFPAHCFDTVIAHHMLYHVPDQPAALREIRRVLKPDGIFFASTIGSSHMKEVDDLVLGYEPSFNSRSRQFLDVFSLENGFTRLSAFFNRVTLFRYPDALMVTDAKLLAEYIISTQPDMPSDKREGLIPFIQRQLQANHGTLHITKDAGLFECSDLI